MSGPIVATGWDRFDPLASRAVAGLNFWSSDAPARLVADPLEVSPGKMPPREVSDTMLSVPDVVEAHDLHVWTVGSGFPALSESSVRERPSEFDPEHPRYHRYEAYLVLARRVQEHLTRITGR